MSKKLLNEGTIRRFMKLAALKPIANEVIGEMAMDYKRDEEDALEEEVDDELGFGTVPVADDGDVEADVELEPELEPELEGDDDGGAEGLVRQIIDSVAALSALAGGPPLEIEDDEVEGEGDEELDMEAGLEEEPPLEEPPLEEEVAAEDAEEAMLETVEAMLAEAGVDVIDDEKLTENLIKKVSSRVVKRLLKEFG